ncbi:MAG: spermidine synthase [Phenylobacterium sp.]|jgi:spermidine synthase
MKNFPGKSISCVYDPIGPVKVFDDGNKRYLTFGDNDEQSCMLKANPALLQYDYNRAMLLVLLFCQPKHIAILGLGGASLTHSLMNAVLDANITVVELRQVVIDVAYKYFALPLAPRLTVIQDNALDYLAEAAQNGIGGSGGSAGSFDVLFSDLFLAEGLETRQLTDQFLTDAAALLSDDGWLVINALEEYRSEQLLHGLLAQYFGTVFECITEDGNWVIIAGKRAEKSDEPVSFKALFPQAKTWSKRLGFSLIAHLKHLKRV